MPSEEKTLQITVDKWYQGLSPLAFQNSLTSFGSAGNASTMTNADVINGEYVTQGPGLADLTNGNQSGVVDELVQFVMDKAVASSQSYAIGTSKLFLVTPTTVTTAQSIAGCVEGESIVPLKGNLYYFFNTATNGEIGKFDLASTYDDNWGCYSKDTEVLTLEGWMKIQDVPSGMMIYSLNPETMKVEAVRNNETIVRPFFGEMIRFKSEGVDILVTPDHKMFASSGLFQKKAKNPNPYKLVHADSLLDKQFRLKKNAVWDGEVKDYWEVPEYDNGSRQAIVRDSKGRIVSTSGKRYYKPAIQYPIKPFLRLLGFYISEGSSNQKCINISQRTFSKGWKSIKQTIEQLGLSYGYYGESFDIHDKQFTQYIKKLIPGHAHEKRIPREILNLHPSLLIELYEALMLGDGYLGTNQYYTVSEGLRDDFVELVNRLGWSAKVFVKDRVGKKAFNGFARYINYTIGVTKEKNEPSFNHHSQQTDTVKENYSDDIVCLALEKNHIMLVRRNGKSVWCGNSTVPIGAASLEVAAHPSFKKEDIIVFGNGRYVGTFINETNTLAPQRLDFGADSTCDDVLFNSGFWYLAINSGITGTNRTEGQIYLWDGSTVPSTLSDETGVGMQRIGFLYRVNGVVFVAYQDLTATGFIIGYIRGKSIVPLVRYTGALPNFRQKTLFNNTLMFLSSGLVYSAGAIIQDLPYQLSQYADGGYATIGAIGAPFGTPMISSTDGGSNFRLAQFSGFDTNSTWKSIVFNVSKGRLLAHINSVVVLTQALGSGASCALTIETDQNTTTSNTLTINTTGKTRHVFNNVRLGRIEDFRISLDYSGGSAVSDCAIRSITINYNLVES